MANEVRENSEGCPKSRNKVLKKDDYCVYIVAMCAKTMLLR